VAQGHGSQSEDTQDRYRSGRSGLHDEWRTQSRGTCASQGTSREHDEDKIEAHDLEDAEHHGRDEPENRC
jgi:hypothetical protein